MGPILGFGFGGSRCPELCVRLIRRPQQRSEAKNLSRTNSVSRMNSTKGADNPSSNATAAKNDEDELLYIWIWYKFLNRLQLMRDVYDSWRRDPKHFQINPSFDPWN